jgi:citrate synthase
MGVKTVNRKYITVNGKKYPLSEGDYGLTLIGGMYLEEFIENLSTEDLAWLAKYGMAIVQNEPEHFDDIADRLEMPQEVKGTLDNFKHQNRSSE